MSNMIKRIIKVQDFGILKNCQNTTGLQPFNKYNVIYGWNGSGKTTLGRLLRCLELKCNHKEFGNARYQVELDDESYIDSTNIDHSLEVRVFNQDFITDHLNLFDAKTNPIIFISKEKIDEKKEYDEKKTVLKNKVAEKKGLTATKEETSRKIDKTHKEAGKSIKDFFLGTVFANVTYNIRTSKDIIWPELQKEDSLRAFILTDSEITRQKNYTLLNSGKEPFELKLLPPALELDKLSEIEALAITHLKEVITSKIIERLRDKPELNNWVKDGLELYRTTKNSGCDFCGNEISESRIQELSDHFSKDYDELIAKLKDIVGVMLKGKRQLFSKDSHLIYDELVTEYEMAVDSFNTETQNLNSKLESWISLLEEKQKNPFVVITPTQTDKELFQPYNDALNALTEVLQKHNALCSSQKQLAETAKDKIEKHFVCKHALADNLKSNETQMQSLGMSIDAYDTEILELSIRLQQLEDDLKSDTIAIAEINNSLHKFLGRNDIVLERVDQGGYQLRRNGVVARNLSEGEKTAISLIYFFSKIQENGADLKNLIIVVDDPVSSFDSNHLFNASAYIKNIVENAKQLFVLTHNFWFFKQVRDWMNRKNESERKKKRPEISNMYVVERGYLKNATEPLMKFHSEYQHVFFTVLKYHQSEVCDDSTCFAIANAGRRLLEGFNSFKTPDNSGFNSIFELAKRKGLDSAKRDRVFFFLNKYSHLDRIESFDNTVETLLEEGRNVATDILWMIKKIDCDHYESMLRVCGFEDQLVEAAAPQN